MFNSEKKWKQVALHYFFLQNNKGNKFLLIPVTVTIATSAFAVSLQVEWR